MSAHHATAFDWDEYEVPVVDDEPERVYKRLSCKWCWKSFYAYDAQISLVCEMCRKWIKAHPDRDPRELLWIHLGRGYMVIYDPCDVPLYRGAVIDAEEIKIGIKMGSLLEGMQFAQRERYYEVRDGRLTEIPAREVRFPRGAVYPGRERTRDDQGVPTAWAQNRDCLAAHDRR